MKDPASNRWLIPSLLGVIGLVLAVWVATTKPSPASAPPPVNTRDGVVNTMSGGSHALNIDWGGKRPITFYETSPGHAIVSSGLSGEPDHELVWRIMMEYARVYKVHVRTYHAIISPTTWSVDMTYDYPTRG